MLIDPCLWVCVDCAAFIANGEVEDPDPEWSEDNLFWNWPNAFLVLNPENSDGPEYEDNPDVIEFSNSECEGCGSYLAGTRYRAAAFEIE